MIHRRRIARVALAATTALASLVAISGCAGDTGSGGSGNKDVLTLGVPADAPWLDPAKEQSNYQGWVKQAVFDTLVRCDTLGTPVPAAAETWTASPDNTTFTAKLRPGMKFTDGTPVDSAAVKASLEFSSKNAGGVERLAGIKVDTPDPATVVITMPKPTPAMTSYMCGGHGLLVSPAFLASDQLSSGNPVASGPYKVDKSGTTPGSVYAFTKNDDYWDAKNFPYKKLVVKIITSETAMINALKTGQIDGAPISEQTYGEAKGSGLGVQTLKGTTTELLLTDHLGQKAPALGNVDVRRAINMVFDKQALAKNLYQGRADVAHQHFRPGSAAYLDGLPDPYTFNVQAAKDLMAKAGYADGFSIELPTRTGVPGMDALTPVVIQQLALLNIKAKQVTLSGPNAISELLSGKYPVALVPLGNLGDSRLDIATLFAQDGIWNLEHQPDATVDGLWAQIQSADDQKSAELQKQLNHYVVDQAWLAPMVNAPFYYAYNDKKVGLQTVSDLEQLNPLLWDFK